MLDRLMLRGSVCFAVIVSILFSASLGYTLHFTQAEIDIWNVRRFSGPYIDDWGRVTSRSSTFLSNPTADNWLGNQLDEHWDGAAVDGGTQPPNAHPGRRQGDGLRDAGLFYLVTGNLTYRDAVVSALLTQAEIPGTDFSNTDKWNVASAVLDQENFSIPNWIRKLAYAYSYVRSTVTIAERATLDTWFLNAATYWNIVLDNLVKTRVPNRNSDDYSVVSGSHNPGASRGITHFGGPTVYSFHGVWENIPATTNAMVSAVAVLLNNQTLKTSAKRFVKEWLMFAVAADGTVMDQYRWNTGSPAAQLGFLYTGTVLGSIITAADHFARAGDAELYTYTTSEGKFGWEGGSKNLLLALRRYAQITLGERGLPNGISIYASNVVTTNPVLRIGPSTTHNQDTFMIPANLYYSDPLILQAYTRTMPSSPSSGGYDVWGGDWGTYSGIRFMFGQQEDIVDPYPVFSLSITSPTANPTYTSHVPVTTISGTFIGSDITSMNFTCPECVVTSGPVTYTPATSTFVLNGLQTNLGVNTVTITAVNNLFAQAVDSLVITRTSDAPDVTTGLQLRLPLEEGQGTIANDESGFNRDGTISGNYNWVAGPFNNWALQLNWNGANIKVPSIFGSPANVTIAGWVQNIVDDPDVGTVVNISDRVGLRVESDRVRGFFRIGGVTHSVNFNTAVGVGWRHLAYVHNGTTQAVYVDGVLGASVSAVALNYSGGSGFTTVGKIALDGNNTQSLNGSVKEVRVYNRALTALDISGLPFAGQTGLSLQIVNPVPQGIFFTQTNTVRFTGTAQDLSGEVEEVTFSCVTCASPTSGIAEGTNEWVLPLVTLNVGDNVFSIQARDSDDNVVVKQVTVQYTIGPPLETAECTHFASRTGGGTGLEMNSPFRVSDFYSVSSLPGKVLCLHDGIYRGANSIIAPPAGLHGTQALPITVKVINDGAVLIDASNLSHAILLPGNWWVVKGMDAKDGLDAVVEITGTNSRTERVIAWNASALKPNSKIFSVTNTSSYHKDCAGWGLNAKQIFAGSGPVLATNAGYKQCFGVFNHYPTGVTTGGNTYQLGRGNRNENVIGRWDLD